MSGGLSKLWGERWEADRREPGFRGGRPWPCVLKQQIALDRRSLVGLWRDGEGSVLVEATVLMPVLLALFLGVFEFAWFFYTQQQVETGVRDAARYLSRVGLPSGDVPCDGDATWTSAVTNAKYIAVYGSTSAGSTPRASGLSASDVTVTCPTYTNNGATILNGGSTLYRVRVVASYADPAFGFFGFLGLGTPNVNISHEERFIGAG